MARCKQDGQDFKQALLQMRTTPISKDLPSPFEILHGRPGRTVNGQAAQTVLNLRDVKWKLIQRQEKTTEHYNKCHAVRELPPLHESQSVLIQHKEGNWEPATVKQVGPEPEVTCVRLTQEKHLGTTENTFKQQECQTSKTATNPASNRRIQHRRHQKTVHWAEEAYITADAETAYFAATQGIDFLLEEPEQPEAAVLLVSEADHSEAAVPVQADAVPAPTLQPVAAAYLDHSEGEKDNQSHLSGSEREGNAEESLLMSKSPVWCLQRHQKFILVQFLTLVKKIHTLVMKNTLVKKNNPEGAGDRGRRFATSPLHRGRANKSRRARLSDFNSKSIF